MNRKLIPVLIPLLMVAVMSGCAKKKGAVTTAPPPPPAQETAPPPPPPPAPEPEPKKEVGPLDGDLDSVNRYVREQGLLGDVYFNFDRSDIGGEGPARLERNARFMKDHPQFVVTIEGHCDERGTTEYNLELGQRRADSARGYMVRLGVDTARMRVISYGEERPTCREGNEVCWSRNRRAHFVISDRR